jgi:RNA polymerase-associated protein RTF1
MDMETESEEEEDGQISKFEEREERDRQLYGQPTAPDGKLTRDDLSKCQITRATLVKHYAAPWFADFCKGTHSHRTNLVADRQTRT